MIFENPNFSEILFEDLADYTDYINENEIHTLLDINLEDYGDPHAKKGNLKPPFYLVETHLKDAFAAELDDLCRLHFLARSRRVTTILEFGCGFSTYIFDDALKRNWADYEPYVSKNLRRSRSFQGFAVDNHLDWINEVKSKKTTNKITFQHADLDMGLFNDRICTYYNPLPNVCPDLIYIDGPDQFTAKGNIRGVSINHADSLPMSADVLCIEHLLLPGTLMVTDGRTANARFLKANLQRDWIYCHDASADVHYFELCETPLGVYNKSQIEFCLGDSYFDRLRSLGVGNR